MSDSLLNETLVSVRHPGKLLILVVQLVYHPEGF